MQCCRAYHRAASVPAGEFANVDSPFKAASVSPSASVEAAPPPPAIVNVRAMVPPRMSLDIAGRATSAPPASLTFAALPSLRSSNCHTDFELTPEELDAPSTRPIPVGKKQPAPAPAPAAAPAPAPDSNGAACALEQYCVTPLIGQRFIHSCTYVDETPHAAAALKLGTGLCALVPPAAEALRPWCRAGPVVDPPSRPETPRRKERSVVRGSDVSLRCDPDRDPSLSSKLPSKQTQ